MQQFLYWRIRISVRYTGPHLTTVLRVLAFTDHQSFPAYDRRISERAHVAYKQQRDPRLAPEHLSSSLHTFLCIARLVVPFSSSELDVRATAHIQRCGQTPRRYGVYSRCCSLPAMDRPLPRLVPGVAPSPSWASKVSDEIISSYRKPQRRLSLTKWGLSPH
jgi:hypothetical protein